MLLSLLFTVIVLVVFGNVLAVEMNERSSGAARLGFLAGVTIISTLDASIGDDDVPTAVTVVLLAIGGVLALLAAYAAFRARRARRAAA